MCYLIKPIKKIDAVINIPSSKSVTHRAMILACLTLGRTHIYNTLRCDDTLTTLNALREIGFDIREKTGSKSNLIVNGGLNSIEVNRPSHENLVINLNESGTTMRFLLALCSVLPHKYKLVGDSSLTIRPIKELSKVLRLLGAVIEPMHATKSLPLLVRGLSKPELRSVHISGSKTSQYLSAMLLIAPLLKGGLQIHIRDGLRSKPYVDLTIRMMSEFGVSVVEMSKDYLIKEQNYKPANYYCEGDYSSASYFLGATAILGGKVILKGLEKNSTQGDKVIIDILNNMGCNVNWSSDESLTLESDGSLKAIDIDMSNYPDLVPALSVVCAYTQGKSVIRDIEHLKYKESDRIQSIQENLTRLGINNEYKNNNIIIYGNQNLNQSKNNILINTRNDHRIAMSFAVAGLKSGTILIDKPDCVNKSFPGFWETLRTMRQT